MWSLKLSLHCHRSSTNQAEFSGINLSLLQDSWQNNLVWNSITITTWGTALLDAVLNFKSLIQGWVGKGFSVPKAHCDFHPSLNTLLWLDSYRAVLGAVGSTREQQKGETSLSREMQMWGLVQVCALPPQSVLVHLLLQGCCSDFTIPLEITDSPRTQQIFPNGEF